MTNRQLMKENTDYELIPQHEDNWHIRLLTTDYIETVVEFTVLKLVDDSIKFDFNVVYSPDTDLSPSDIGLQQVVGDVLFSILETTFREQELNVEH